MDEQLDEAIDLLREWQRYHLLGRAVHGSKEQPSCYFCGATMTREDYGLFAIPQTRHHDDDCLLARTTNVIVHHAL
jgi:hypothetical protein